MRTQRIILLILFSSLFQLLKAQVHEKENNLEHEKREAVYEIITSGIYAYSLEHKEGVFGTEVHFTYWANHKWGGGISYTHKYTEHKDINEFALLGSFNPKTWMTLNVGPNFAFLKENGRSEMELGAYVEAEINVRPVERFHFGPLLGTVIQKNMEITIGFHLGFEF